MSPLACYFSNGILVLMLVGLFLSSQKERKQLLSRLLEKNDIPGIPEESPMGEMLRNLGAEPAGEAQPGIKIKGVQERVVFNIPNMPTYRAK
jgi:hypothetical protein